MSTILKSLKKVEKENITAQAMGVFSPSIAQTVIHNDARIAWLKSKFLQWGILGIALFAGVVALYAYSRPNQTPVNSPTGSAAAPASEHLVAATIPPQHPGVQPQKPPPPSLARPAETSPKMKANAEKASKPLVSINLPAGTVSPNSLDPSVPPLSLHSIAPAEGAPVTPTPYMAPKNESPRSSQENRQYANAEHLTDGRLKVQAIVWSVNADDRMAVVNNRIVREGGVLNGFSIVGIGQDVLYVSEAGRMLAVPFGKH